jgi:hypothetical protein
MTDHPWLGQAVIVRTVGEIVCGTLREITPQELLLDPAAWIADTGRWSECLSTGGVAECEPYLDAVRVGRGTIVTWTLWRHAVPTEVL